MNGDDSTGPGRRPSTIRDIGVVGAIVLAGMSLYELLKQSLFPDITLWRSHLATIAFSTLAGMAAAYFALRARRRLESRAVGALSERLTAEEKLRRSEERFRSLVDNSEEVIGLLDRDGRWTYVSTSVERLWGYTVEEMLAPREFGKLTHPEDRPGLIQAFRQVAENVRPSIVWEFRGRHKDGSWRTIQASLVNRLEDPSVGAIVGNFRDISDQKAAEAALRLSEERFRTLIERSPVAIGLARNGMTVYANAKYLEMYGYPSLEEVVRLPLIDHWAPQSRAEVRERLRRRDLGLPVTAEFEAIGRRKNGSQFPVHAATGLLELADGPANIAFLTDITERRNAETALRESQLVIERSQEVAQVGSWRWDMTREPPRLEWSSQLLRLLGLPDSVEGPAERLFLELTHPDDRAILAARRQALFNGKPWDETFQLRMRHADGRYRWFRSRGRPQFDAEGRLTEVIGAAQDITDQVEAQELLRRSETMAALGNLVAAVAHEVRNPLFAISGTIDALEADIGDLPNLRDYTVVLRREIGRLSGLMHDLLEYGRPLSVELARASVRPIIERAAAACEGLAGERRVETILEVAEDLPEVLADPARLVQVFQNLIQNAVEHSRPGSRVLVRAAPGNGDRGSVVATVEDSGPGILDEDLPHLFEPFFSRRAGGTGLGLSIVERILEQHGGQILAGNRPEGGAILTVRLPTAK